MNSQESVPDAAPDLPEAVVDQSRRFSLIWLIPLVAVVAALWLGYRTYSDQGPLVTLSFDTAEGLEAGITRVRYKDVNIGRVETIGLSADLSRVEVRARLSPDVTGYLTAGTRFWVVRPRFSRGQISGLNTLVGGAFIAVDLSNEGTGTRVFDGLESPPLVTASDAGRTFTLHADNLGSLSVGSPVYYRDIEVGRVLSFELIEPAGVEIKVFVNAPHDRKVRNNTRFWNTSGIGLTVDDQGLRLTTESIAALLLGGVSFATPADETPGAPPQDAHRFELYPDRDTATTRQYEHKQPWLLEFDGSVRGLQPGAAVEFRGIRIGTVRAIELELDTESRAARIPVTVDIEPERLGLEVAQTAGAAPAPDVRKFWEQLVGKGLRARLKSGNLLTGSLFVDLDFYPDDAPKQIVWREGIGQLPTVPTPLDELTGLMSRLSRLPLERMVEEFDAAVVSLRKTLDRADASIKTLDRKTMPAVARTLEQTRQTLRAAEKLLTPGSPLQLETQRLLQELTSAARSIRIMADYLERHPEALIRGKGVTQ